MIALPLRRPGGRLGARAGTVRATCLVLAAALLRAALLPLGDGLSTIAFGACLLGFILLEPGARPAEARWGRGWSVAAGAALGLLLVAPLLGQLSSVRPLSGFIQWGAIAALVATLEELAIRGRLQQRWTEDAGPTAAIIAGAAVFALIHLPASFVAGWISGIHSASGDSCCRPAASGRNTARQTTDTTGV